MSALACSCSCCWVLLLGSVAGKGKYGKVGRWLFDEERWKEKGMKGGGMDLCVMMLMKNDGICGESISVI